MEVVTQQGARGGSGGALRAFGQYRLVRKLAMGGMAEIFLAKQLGPHGFERDVVIKRLRPELSRRHDFLSMFLDEARLAARLSHPNVVQIHDVGLLQQYYFICMEHLPGEDLGLLIREARKQEVELPMTLCARVIARAAHGLHYAHELTDEAGEPLKIVHRDVSPSNLFVTYGGNVKVLDFGIARAEARLTLTGGGQLKGKVPYLAPEQALGNPADRRSDIYMLGLTLYEALTLVQPFAGENPVEILRAVLAANVPPVRMLRPEVCEALADIVHKAMHPDPEARYQTCGELASALELYLSNFTTSTANAETKAYLRMLLGDERIRQRSRLPSLATLMARGAKLTGFTHPDQAGHAPAQTQTQTQTQAATPPPPMKPQRPAIAPPSTPEVPRPPAPVEPPPAPGPVSGRALRGAAFAAGLVILVAALGAALLPPTAEGGPAVVMPPALHTIQVQCDEVGAQVLIDGAALGACPVSVPVEAGEHEVVVTLDGRTALELVTAAGPPRTMVLHVALPPQFDVTTAPAEAVLEWAQEEDAPGARKSRRARPTGRVTFDTVPWTRVYAGRKLLGDTPIVEAELPAGRHTLILVNAEKGIRRSVTVTVRPGRTTTQRVELEL